MRTELRKCIDPAVDADTLHIHTDAGGTIDVYAYLDHGGDIRIDVDRNEEVGQFRIYVDDLECFTNITN